MHITWGLRGNLSGGGEDHLGVNGKSQELGKTIKNHNNRPASLACLRLLVSRSYPLFSPSLSTFFSAFGFELWSKSF